MSDVRKAGRLRPRELHVLLQLWFANDRARNTTIFVVFDLSLAVVCCEWVAGICDVREWVR
jgi:hypothetical protein